jgi:methyltransferase (TIGR00027 family)
VQDDQASGTALLIAASLVLLHRDPKYSGLISSTSADLCARILEANSAQTRLFLKIVRQGWFRPIAKLIERVTIPGILLYYALRKKCIATLARSALTNGTTQVAVVGAGFDPLSLELQLDFPVAEFWEIDHPATQRQKRRALPKIGAERLHFVAVDLSATGLDREVLIESSFDPTQPTFWIAEGLLMYLRPEKVSSLMRASSSLSTPGSQVAFTFMEKGSADRIRFDSQSKLVDWWLHRHAESFVWATTRSDLVELVRPWRVVRFFDHDDLRQMKSGLANEPIARGEVICLTEI